MNVAETMESRMTKAVVNRLFKKKHKPAGSVNWTVKIQKN
jgi:hypothetical protein